MSKPFRIHDKYFYLAKEKGYRARSAFKLLEIQKKFKIFKPGQAVLDLGAAPGSFLQVISEFIGPNGTAVGLDLQAIEAFDDPRIRTYEVDILDSPTLEQIFSSIGVQKFDVLVADLAPKTTGIKDLDQGRSLELTEASFETAQKFLKPGGYFISKLFQGPESHFFLKRLKGSFQKVQTYKPEACRDRSFEMYVIGIGFRGALLK